MSYAGWQPDPWVDRLPRLLEPMGVVSLTASSGREATRMIESFPIHIAIVDLALPFDATSCGVAGPGRAASDEAGAKLLELLARLSQPPPTVVVKRSRSTRDDRREMSAALRAGAFAVVDRPRDASDLERILEVLRRCLLRHYQGRWPGGCTPGG
ncbi:MAG: hypothetical protein SFZ23_15560 [Planctomycetota bacterium]|nr:hypothetical protein [Planctomycetota bacterium]